MSILFICLPVSAGKYLREINEIRIYEDYVKIDIGITYGTCKDSNNKEWWGWPITSPNHQAWLSLALLAKASGKKLMFYDSHSSCNSSIAGVIGVEGLFLSE